VSDPEPRRIAPRSREFPDLLTHIAPPVDALWVVGRPLDQLGPFVAIVGARGPTAYGLEVARGLAGDLASLGICIVSGMARGIDAAAHEGALDAGGTTVAVLGTGVDRAYPAVHRPLYTRIAENGAVVSELPLGAGARKEHFPARNRIIAGMSLATILVQARKEKSGAMGTVERAGHFGREVFAVPGDVRSELSTGPHHLLKDGAALCAGASDVLEVLGDRFADAGLPGFGSLERRVLGELKGDKPRSPESIALSLGLDAIEASRALGRLELAGAVARDGAGYRRL